MAIPADGPMNVIILIINTQKPLQNREDIINRSPCRTCSSESVPSAVHFLFFDYSGYFDGTLSADSSCGTGFYLNYRTGFFVNTRTVMAKFYNPFNIFPFYEPPALYNCHSACNLDYIYGFSSILGVLCHQFGTSFLHGNFWQSPLSLKESAA